MLFVLFIQKNDFSVYIAVYKPATMTPINNVYILDDELPILEPLALWFRRKGYAVKTFTNSTDLLKTMLGEKPDILFVDINLSGEDGRNLCRLVKVKYRNRLPVVLFSASPSLGENFAECDADAFIPKPFSFKEISKVMSECSN